MNNTVVERWMKKNEFLKYANIKISRFYQLIALYEWRKKGIIRKTGNKIDAVCLEKYNKWLEERQ